MEKFEVLTGVAAPLMIPNIDTDVIIRIEALAKYGRNELGPHALAALRYRADGSENPGFILNQPAFRDAAILLAAENFGCGSSRENAVWALMDMGLRAVIAPSFGEIFFGNCFQNGMLPVRLPAAVVERMAAELLARADAGQEPLLTLNLAEQRISTPAGEQIAFDIEPLRKTMLMNGVDEIGLTLTREADIALFQARDRATRPWLYA